MQYISIDGDDLKPGNKTFVLERDEGDVSFLAYSGDTAFETNDEAVKRNADLKKYFLKKGFSFALKTADPDVVEPVYKNLENEECKPSSADEAIHLIYSDKLTVSGFRFKEDITDRQRDEALGKLINCFVSASKNLDFSSDKNLFCVQNDGIEVAYNNGGSESMQIDGPDVQEKLGLDTIQVKAKELRRTYANEAVYPDDCDYEPDYQQNSENLKRDLFKVKNGTNEEKLNFIEEYGYLFDSNSIDESAISKKTYGELSSLVKDSFNENKNKFKDNRELFIAGISILERSNCHARDDAAMNSKNVMTMVDMFKHCGEQEGSTFGYSLSSCGNINAEAARYVLNNAGSIVDDPQSLQKIKAIVLEESPDYKKQKEAIKNKKSALKERLANKKETDKISGVVVTDKIAQAQISGVIDEPVTPEKGKVLADKIKRKLISDKQR